MQPRTKRQREILNFIGDFIKDHGYQPSYQQIAKHFNVKSKGGIAKHIESLERLGLIERNIIDGKFRLELIPQSQISDMICEVEWIPTPNRYSKHEQSILYIPKMLIGIFAPHHIRAITVSDNGMQGYNISEDDIALIETKTFVRDGEIVATLVENTEIIVRKYYRLGAKIELVPANEKFETRVFSADKIKILGIFRCLIRPYM